MNNTAELEDIFFCIVLALHNLDIQVFWKTIGLYHELLRESQTVLKEECYDISMNNTLELKDIFFCIVFALHDLDIQIFWKIIGLYQKLWIMFCSKGWNELRDLNESVCAIHIVLIMFLLRELETINSCLTFSGEPLELCRIPTLISPIQLVPL